MEFDLGEHPFVPLRSYGVTACKVDVAIVGAGPSGMALALDLGQRGLSVALLEARGAVSDGSRAILFDRQTINYLDRLGLAGRFLDAAAVRETNTIYYGKDQVYQTSYRKPDFEKFPQFAVLQQCYLEAILVDALKGQENVSLRWHSAVEGLRQTADGACLSVRTPEGTYSLEARHVVATDGARGPMKKLCNLRYESPLDAAISDRTFVICDFVMKTDLTKGRRMFVFPPTRPEGIMLMHSQPFDTWRLDYPLTEGESIDEELRPETVRARIDAHLAMMEIDASYEVVWTTSYRARAACLPRLVEGAVVFAGDAAHLSPIFGGRGLNLGFADTATLGWRLAGVVQGRLPAEVLQDYSRERVDCVMSAFSRIGQATIFITAPTEGTRFMRRALMPLANDESCISELFDPHRAPRGEVLELPLAEGAIESEWTGHQLSGLRLRSSDGEEAWAQDLIGPDGMWLAIGAAPDLSADPRKPVVTIGTDAWADHAGDVAAKFGTRPQLIDIRPDSVIAAVYPAQSCLAAQ